MYSISAGFQSALLNSHTVLDRVEVLSGGVVVRTLDTVVAGSVTINKKGNVRRSCQVSIVDDGTLVPAVAGTGTLAPLGNELRLWRGVRWYAGATATDELVPLGTFRISATKISDTGRGLSIDVTGYDRSRAIGRNRYLDPYTIAAGTDYVTAIKNLILDRRPTTTFAFPAVGTITSTTPQVVITSTDDPWKVASDLAEAVGYELFFDALGVCTMRREPDPTTAPVVWTYAEGASAILLSAERVLDDQYGYNVGVYTGTSPYGNVRGIARDTNPASPTYYLGPYGSVPIFDQSNLVTDQSGVDAAATALLNKNIGVTDTVAFTAVANPAHDVSDVVQITRLRAGIQQLHVLDVVRVGLGAKTSLAATTRARRVTS